MASQTITTRFKSEGAGRVAKDTEAIGRAQTRLGQASASSGRSFAAQASGLGGLVGVYAAAAANVFAITAAFDALGRAAQAEQIVRGTKLLALEIGQNGKTILDNVQQITQSQLTLAESAQNINIALSAGFNTSQIEALSEVSLKASRALGRNLTDAFQRVVRGAAKLEPELLDELGIFTRIDPAVEAYANKLNIATNSLTNYEKRQAFVNAVIEEGQKKFSAIDTTVDNSQKTFEQLRVALTELALEFGQLVANVLAPIASFFKDNLGAALLLFGGILALVFGRAISAISGFATGALQNFSAFSAGLSKAALESSKNFDIIRSGITDLENDIKGRGGIAQGGGRFAQQGVSREAASGAAQARRRFLAGGADPVQQKKDIAVLKEVRKNLNSNTKAFSDADTIINSYEKSQKGATLATKGFAGVARTAAVAARGLSVAISTVTAALGSVFAIISIAQLVGTLFDVDVLAEIKKFFVDTSKATAELKAGFAGAVSLTGGEELIKQLKILGDTDEDLEKLPERIQKIQKPLNRLLSGTGGINTMVGGMIRQNMSIDAFKSLGDNVRRIVVLQAALTQETNKGTDADRKKVAILESLIEAQRRFGSSQKIAGGIADQLGISTAKVLTNLERFITVTDDKTIINFGRTIDLTNKSLGDLDEETRKVVTDLVLLENTLNKADEAFENGTASSETLSKQLGGARATLEELIEAQEQYAQFFGRGDNRAIKEARERVNTLNEQVRSLKTLEIQGKALTDTFGKFGATLDKAVQQGLVGLSGGISKDSAEIAKNQAKFLSQAAGFSGDNAEKIAIAVDRQERGLKLDAEQVKLVENRGRALKSIAGLALSIVPAVEKETQSRIKTVMSLQQQIALLRLQNDLQKTQNDLALQRERQTTASEVGKAGVTIQEKQLELSQARNDSLKIQRDFELEILRIQGQRAAIASQIEDVQANREAAAAQGGRTSAIEAQKSVIADFQAFPNLRSQEQLQQEQRKLIELELANKLAIIDAQEEQSARAATRELEAVLLQQEAINKQIENTNAEREFAKQQSAQQAQIRQANQALELSKLAGEKENLAIQEQIAEKQLFIALKQIEADQAKFDLDNKNAERTLSGLRTQQQTVNAFIDALNSDNNPFVNAIKALVELEGGDASAITQGALEGASADFTGLENLQTQIEGLQNTLLGEKTSAAFSKFEGQADILDEQANRLQQITDLTTKRQVIENQLAQIQAANDDKKLANESAILNEELATLDSQIDLINEKFAAEQAGYETSRTLAEENADEQIRGLMRVKQTLGDLGSAVIGNLSDGLGNAINTAFDNIAQGQSITQGLGDVLRGTFENVRKTVLEETLVKPLQEKLKSGLGSMFGMEEKGAENATVRGGALLVTSDDGTTPKEITADVSEKATSVFDTIKDKLGEFGEKGKEIFSGFGDKLGSVFSSIGNSLGTSGSGGGGFFGKIFGGLSSVLGFGGQGTMTGAGGFTDGGAFSGLASGGFVPFSAYQRLAAGGQARDRVPALLEPGEFVMKRSSANSIGAPALNQMNATGKAGGNVVVNIQNQGTPQDATASEPRFDGEKFVIDIVTRDLRNNGPIRKSLRGGGAG